MKKSDLPPRPVIKQINVRGNVLLFEIEPDKFKDTDEFNISYGNDYDDAFKSRNYKKLKKEGNFLKFRTTWLPLQMCFCIECIRKSTSKKHENIYLVNPTDFLLLNTKIQGDVMPEFVKNSLAKLIY